MEKMDLRASELLETWINGNRTDVMEALSNMSSMEAACVSALIIKGLMPFFGGEAGYQVEVWEERANDFIRMMERRVT